MIDNSLPQEHPEEHPALAEIRNKLESLAEAYPALSKLNLTGARSDDGCMARVDCPANEGHRGGLVIALEPNDLVTLRCENGCSGESVADALAITDALISVEGEVTLFALSAPAPQQATHLGGKRKKRNSPNARVARVPFDHEYFHTPSGEAFASVRVGDHRETYSIRSRAFRLFTWFELRRKNIAAKSEALHQWIEEMESIALFEGSEQEVHIRIAGYEGKFYVDLCNPRWEAIEITGGGWNIVSEPPVKFRRARGMLPLPPPVLGGSVTELRRFLNVASDPDFVLLVHFLIACFRPTGPYPIPILTAEQGSAKTSLERVLRGLVDPSTAPVRPLPGNERDLSISASNSWMQVFDNLSGISGRMADALCRLATGGGFATRELYTDRDEALFGGARPVVLDGIEPLAERPDLADRALLLEPPPILDNGRMTEQEFQREFEEARPRIMGALLDAVSAAIRNLPNVNLESKPRMADFAVCSVAAELALPWPPGSFMRAYEANRADIAQVVLESDILSDVLRTYLDRQDLATGAKGIFQGTAADLLASLNVNFPDVIRSSDWPRSPNKLSGRLRRLAPALRRIGIEVGFAKSNGRRLIKVQALSKPTDLSTLSTLPREPAGHSSPLKWNTGPTGPVKTASLKT